MLFYFIFKAKVQGFSFWQEELIVTCQTHGKYRLVLLASSYLEAILFCMSTLRKLTWGRKMENRNSLKLTKF